MNKFDYDINKYMSYRKTTRNEEIKDDLEIAISELKKRMIHLVGNNECQLSDNARRMIHDIERRIKDEEIMHV